VTVVLMCSWFVLAAVYGIVVQDFELVRQVGVKSLSPCGMYRLTESLCVAHP